MYPYLNMMLGREAEASLSRTEQILRTTKCGEALKTWGLRNLMTPVARDAVCLEDEDEPLPEVAVKKMLARATLQERKALVAAEAKMDNASDAEYPEKITITVEWKRSRSWGLNPTATVSAGSCITTGSATGCGYDKESAAVASAMNKNYSILKVWYEHAERGGQFEYSVSGADRSMLPHMDGGCGMSAVTNVFKKLGFRCEEEHGNVFDMYIFYAENTSNLAHNTTKFT